jgi:uncharacterized protein YqeY
MLLADIKTDMMASLKKGDSVRVLTLRMLISAVRNVAIDTYGASGESSMTDEDVKAVIKKQVKQHKESITAFESAGRPELADKEKGELAILSAFLPSELSDEELSVLLKPVADKGGENFGLLMKDAMAAVAGKAGGDRVSAILRKLMAK